MNLQGYRNDASESRLVAFSLVCLVVQECGFHVKPMFGFEFLRNCSGFLQNQSHMPIEILIGTINGKS